MDGNLSGRLDQAGQLASVRAELERLQSLFHGMGQGYCEMELIAKGSSLRDPSGLFNASLTGVRRALDIREHDDLDDAALKALVQEAAAVNAAGSCR